ncbi:MAG: thermonuclease family protein [Beijerinckiaceae bacterium]
MSRRFSLFLSSLAILLASAGILYLLSGAPQRDITGAAEAIDGDSLRLAGEEMRLKGIDAPEFSQTCQVARQTVDCGRESRAALRKLLRSGLVTCIGGERDRFGRLLVSCRVRGVDINAAMVRDGQAMAFGGYDQEEAEAKAAFRGLWAGEFERPQDWRRRHRNDAPQR